MADRRQEETYINWVRDALCVQYVKEALEEISDRRAAGFHELLHRTVLKPFSTNGPTTSKGHFPQQFCQTCTSDNVKRHKNGWRVDCNSKVCRSWLDVMLTFYDNREPKIYSRNFSPRLWPTHSWEVAKLYQSFGCGGNTCAKDADVAALLTFLKNCQYNRKTAPNKQLIEEVLNIRNTLMHTGSMRVEDSKLQQDTDKMIEMLQRLNCQTVSEKDHINEAIEKIKKVQSKNVEVTLNAEVRALHVLLEKAAGDSRKTTDIVQKLQSELQSMKREIEKRSQEEPCEVKVNSNNTTRLQSELIQHYMGGQSLLVSSPVVDDEALGLDEIYVRPDIKVLRETSNPRAGLVTVRDKSIADSASMCKNLFFTEQYQNKQIYVVGNAGTGKTALCKYLVSLWCQAHNLSNCGDAYTVGDISSTEGEQEQQQETNKNIGHCDVRTTEKIRREEEEDRKIIEKFELLFYISLRESPKHYTISDMIDAQILKHIKCLSHLKSADILQNGKCLVLADGLDEWACPANVDTCIAPDINPGIPGRELRSNNVFLTTARSWKLTVLNLKGLEIDKQVELCGLNETTSQELCTKYIDHVKKVDGTNEELPPFSTKLDNKGLKKFHNIPILLILLIGLWLDNQDLSQSRLQLFCSMLELLLKRASKKNLPQQSKTDSLNTEWFIGISSMFCVCLLSYIIPLPSFSLSLIVWSIVACMSVGLYAYVCSVFRCAYGFESLMLRHRRKSFPKCFTNHIQSEQSTTDNTLV